jgi:hypothetical protein
MPDDFYTNFTAFTYQRGIDHIAAGGDIEALNSSTLFEAFKIKHPEHVRIHLNHYFPRHEWMAAVNAGDCTMFRAKRIKSTVQEAATIQEKMALCPDLQPVLDWCARWLHSAPTKRRKYIHLREAFDAEVDAALSSGSENPPFTKTLDNHIACYGINFKQLKQYAYHQASGTHPPQDADLNGYDSSAASPVVAASAGGGGGGGGCGGGGGGGGFAAAAPPVAQQNSVEGFQHLVLEDDATEFASDNHSQGEWTNENSQGEWSNEILAAQQLATLATVTAPSDAAKVVDGSIPPPSPQPPPPHAAAAAAASTPPPAPPPPDGCQGGSDAQGSAAAVAAAPSDATSGFPPSPSCCCWWGGLSGVLTAGPGVGGQA